MEGVAAAGSCVVRLGCGVIVAGVGRCEVAVRELGVALVGAVGVGVVDVELVGVADVEGLGVELVRELDVEGPDAEEPRLFEDGHLVDAPRACSALQAWFAWVLVLSAVPGLRGIQGRQLGP